MKLRHKMENGGKRKKTGILAACIGCEIIAVIVVLCAVMIPMQRKNAFIAEYGQDIYDKFGLVKEGAYITFGEYEQDNDTANGKEDIEWLVLEVKDGRALVISKYGLECIQYDTKRKGVTWEDSSLRKWLNEDFLNSAFSDGEKAMIPTVTVSPDMNPEYDTAPGNATQDKVFALSIAEADTYFESESARRCRPTEHTIENDVWVTKSGHCWWWLRTPGDRQNCASCILNDGAVDTYGLIVDYVLNAVRPAMWIDLKS